MSMESDISQSFVWLTSLVDGLQVFVGFEAIINA